MSFWGREASARRGRCWTTHLCPSPTSPAAQCVTDPPPPRPQGPFPPSLLLLKAIEGREHLIWENTPFSAEFGEGGRKTQCPPLAVSRDQVYTTASETTPRPVYFLCQPGPCVKWGCPASAQWSACLCELKPKRYVRKGLVSC